MNTPRFLDKFICKEHTIIVEGTDMARVLAIITKHYKTKPEFSIKNCICSDNATQWTVRFYCSNEKWDLIRNELCITRIWNVESLLKENIIGKVYSTD